jgi:hypothetical protein
MTSSDCRRGGIAGMLAGKPNVLRFEDRIGVGGRAPKPLELSSLAVL